MKAVKAWASLAVAAALLIAATYFAIAALGGSKIAPTLGIVCSYYAGLILGRAITAEEPPHE